MLQSKVNGPNKYGGEYAALSGIGADGNSIDPASVIQFSKPSSGKIIYEGVLNEYTDEEVLVPYLSVTRKWLDYNYFIRDKTWEGEGSPLNITGKGKMDRYNIPGGYDPNGASFSAGFEYIYNNLFVYAIKNELNAGNKSAYPKGRYTSSYIQDAMVGGTADDNELATNDSNYTEPNTRFDSDNDKIDQAKNQNDTVGAGQISAAEQTGATEQEAKDSTTSAEKGVDLYKEYENSLWYTVGDKGTRTYKIPFRVLLDRFLPNANLMASWRHLTDETNSTASIEIVNEIQKIYSKACLEDETGGGEPVEMSNSRTFAYMGEALVESNLFKHWSAIQEERYVFVDAFEGIAFGTEKENIDGEVTISWTEYELVEVSIPDDGDNDSNEPQYVLIEYIDGKRVETDIDEKRYRLLKDMLEYGDASGFEVGIKKNNGGSSEPIYKYEPVPKEETCSLQEVLNGKRLDGEKYFDLVTKYYCEVVDEKDETPSEGETLGEGETPSEGETSSEGEKSSEGENQGDQETEGEGENKDVLVAIANAIAKSPTGDGEVPISEELHNELEKNPVSGYRVSKRSEIDSISYLEAVTAILDAHVPEEAREEGGLGYWYDLDSVLLPYEPAENYKTYTMGGKEFKLPTTNPNEEYIARTGEVLHYSYLAVAREETAGGDRYGGRDYDKTLPTNADPAANDEVNQIGFNIVSLKDLDGIESQDDTITLSPENLAGLIKKKLDDSSWANGKEDIAVNVELTTINFYATFPIDKKEIAYRQSVWAKSMPFYLTLEATTWSSVKRFSHVILQAGTFDNPENYHFVIKSNNFAKGYMDYKCKMKVDWRCELFAPVLAGDENEAATKARESDVLVILSEWEEAADEGIGAADYFVRDLRALIEYSKGVEEGRDGGSTAPVTDKIHEDSYAYLYIKDEILEFDEALAEPIFWTNRLFATIGDDEIDEETENKMKSRMVTKTWQNVDYPLYDECKTGSGAYAVYALWPFGAQYSGLLYAMAANSCEKENLKIYRDSAAGWGGYSEAHQANDLYGRMLSAEIFETGRGIITSSYSNGKTELHGINGTGGLGLYFNDVQQKLTLDGTEYTFNGTQAAVYGYALYTKTAQLKDAEEAERQLQQELDKEMYWTRINAIAPGIVTTAGVNTTAGFYVVVRHTDDVSSLYCHMKRYPEVQVGEYVGAGTLLGYEGTTGRSGGNHLHNELRIDGDRPNPTFYYYPFFTPFFYEEKADEVERSLSSEYMSYERTIFPYQQTGWYHGNEDGENVDFAGDKVVIKNYTPTNALVPDYLLLYDKSHERYVDYSKLPTSGVGTDLEGEDFEMLLTTSNCFFDEDFIREMEERSQGSGDAFITTVIKGDDDDDDPETENIRKPGGNNTPMIN